MLVRQFGENISLLHNPTKAVLSHLSQLRTEAGQGAFDPAESIASRTVWDMMASWQFSENFSTYVKVDNLFDKSYEAARRPAGLRPGLPRTAYVGVTYRL